MAGSDVFELTAEEITKRTSLLSIEARGTLRIALKRAGLGAATVTPEQMQVVLERVFPNELECRGVEDARNLCLSVAERIQSLASQAPTAETPEAVFQRMGGTG